MLVLKNALVNVRGIRQRALEAITLEYATFFKIPLTDLFLLSRDQYTNLRTVFSLQLTTLTQPRTRPRLFLT
jgi:hypothetical protein